jgi:hypothetical protein
MGHALLNFGGAGRIRLALYRRPILQPAHVTRLRFEISGACRAAGRGNNAHDIVQ